jgi:hypothetical protein
MRRALGGVCTLTLLLCVPVSARAQRLSNSFGAPYEPQLVLVAPHSTSSAAHLQQPRECHARPLLIAAGMLGGALGGYVGYEILWGIWPGDPSGFWGRPWRTTLVVSGAVVGAVSSARQLSRRCARAGA